MAFLTRSLLVGGFLNGGFVNFKASSEYEIIRQQFQGGQEPHRPTARMNNQNRKMYANRFKRNLLQAKPKD